jgi:hypothetical protein
LLALKQEKTESQYTCHLSLSAEKSKENVMILTSFGTSDYSLLKKSGTIAFRARHRIFLLSNII